MDMNMDANFDDFFGAFEGADGNQTEPAEDTAEVETTEEPAADGGAEDDQQAQEEPESGEPSEEEHGNGAENGGAEGEPEPEKPVSEQKFVVKVNKETREVSYQDAPAWIQKGMDYDRVKGQLEAQLQSNQTLQAEIDKHKPILEVLELAAQNSGMDLEQMVETVHVGLLKAKGMTEAEAKAEIRAAKAEKLVKDLTEKQKPVQEETPPVEDGTARAQREFAEFRQNFPEVQLNDELIEKLAPDVQKGMSLTSAYLKLENARLKSEAEAQKQKEAAAVQNKRNRAKTPGSQQDSGGQHGKDATDDFFAAFEK